MVVCQLLKTMYDGGIIGWYEVLFTSYMFAHPKCLAA